MHEFLAWLEASSPAAILRQSAWLYPAANVVHVLALMGFFAAVAAMDFRLLHSRGLSGARGAVARLRPVATVLLVVMAVSGAALFLPEATHIGHNRFFLFKLVAIATALANVAMLEIALRRPGPTFPAILRVSAVASLALWLVVAALGRLIAYV